MSETATRAKRRLEELVSYFGLNVEAEVNETEEGVELHIPSGQGTPRLIGHHGETLRAIEYLLGQMMKRIEGESSPRIMVDVAGYRKARREALEQLAQDAAERVRESGEEEELKPMNPAERRIVHMALRDLPGITTESRGTDRSRRIVVLPAE